MSTAQRGVGGRHGASGCADHNTRSGACVGGSGASRLVTGHTLTAESEEEEVAEQFEMLQPLKFAEDE